jgi:hypothetical protein
MGRVFSNIIAFIRDPLGIGRILDNINSRASELQKDILDTHQRQHEILLAFLDFDSKHGEYVFYQAVKDALDRSLPDMMWAKDIHGRYIIANKSIRDNLLFCDIPFGKTDVQMSNARKEEVGYYNHTFGEMCGNSDKEVLTDGTPRTFIESGIITGEEKVLKVHKNIIKDSMGNVIGTVGTGRDITEEYTTLVDIMSTTTCNDTREKITAMLDKYRFWG